MREDRPTTNDDTRLDRAIDQALREMVSEAPPAGLSTRVRWLLLQDSARRDGGAVGDQAAAAGPAWAARPWRRAVPAASALAVLLVAAMVWMLGPAGPGPDQRGPDRAGTTDTLTRGTIIGRQGASVGAAGESRPVAPSGSVPGAEAAAPLLARAGVADTRGALGAVGGITPPAAAAETRAADAGGTNAAAAPTDVEEDPRFPQLVVVPLPTPEHMSLNPVQLHDVTIADISIRPLEIAPLDASAAATAGAATSDKDAKREERQ